jgi:hypothetical protein
VVRGVLEPSLFLLDEDLVSDVDEHAARIIGTGLWSGPSR